MKHVLPILALVFLATACKTETKKESTEAEPELSILEKVAYAHGYAQWKDVNEIAFTFNVDRDTMHFERTWIWETKTNRITSISGQDTLVYNRNEMDSVAYKTNGGFINDRFWAMAPFNMMWDKDNFTYEHAEKAVAPISQDSLQKLTLVYANEGGYTPGDAYDFYLGDDFKVREWVFRKANQEDPSMMTTWENYQSVDGFQFAQDHKRQGTDDFNIAITGIKIK